MYRFLELFRKGEKLVKSSFLKSYKSLLIGISSLIFVLILTFVGIHAWFANTTKWEYNIKNTDDELTHFENVSVYCLEYIDQESRVTNRFIFSYSVGKNALFYNGQRMKLAEDVESSLEEVANAFPNKDAQLDAIICQDGTVYFTTNNGVYSVVYSKSIPQSVDGIHNGDSKKIDDNWYHVVKK